MTVDSVVPDNYRQIRTLLVSAIKQNNLEIPMLPEVANKVVQLTQDSESDASKLSSLIQGDQTLAAHVMRIANSAAYSPNGNIASLQQAISRLGMQTITEIALAASVNADLFKAKGYEEHISQTLRFSLASGLWAKEVARACRKNVEAAFLSGLLHNIGQPVAVQTATSFAAQNLSPLNADEIHGLETEFKQILGMVVVKEWAMPKAVRNAIQYFNDYLVDHDGKYQTMCVVAGATLAEADLHTEEACEALIAQPIFADINLYQDEVKDLLNKASQIESSIEAMSV